MNEIIVGIIIILYIMAAILTGCILDVSSDDDSAWLCAVWPLWLIIGLFYLWYRVANKIAKKIRDKFGLND